MILAASYLATLRCVESSGRIPIIGSRPTSCRIKLRPWVRELEGVQQTSTGLGPQPWVGTGSRLYITPRVHHCENGALSITVQE